MAAQSCLILALFLFLLYSPHVVISMTNTITSTVLCHDHERSALLHFKQSLSLKKSASYDFSAYPKTESWNINGESGSDCCSWYGVECNDNTGYVIGLHLSSSLLYGTIRSNSTIFSLVHLQTLNLADNNFRNSPIPHEITHLLLLSTLNLSFSVFSGQIPLELSRLSKLTSLDLSYNNLHGGFPVSIFHLPELLVLNVTSNEDLNGYFPEFNQTSPLKALDFAYTNFSGDLPASVGYLHSLTKIMLSGSYFSGSIPASIGLSNLTFIDLSYNKFYGDFPVDIFHLPDLLVLDVGGNDNVTGFLPEFNQTSSLRVLKLGFTSFSGNLPVSIGNLQSLTELQLDGCYFSGSIPASIAAGLSKLTSLDLSFNNLYGEFPVDIFYLPDLLVLDVGDNDNLTGFLPVFNQTSSLRELKLDFTSFSGNLPASIENLQSLTKLQLERCYFSGSIPDSIGNLTQLTYLSLSLNMFNESKKLSWLDKLTKLTLLELEKTSLYGSIPSSLGNLTQLTSLNLESNNFSGEVPIWLMNMTRLTKLLLASNELTGRIPSSFSQLKNLERITLSGNNLVGRVEPYIFLRLQKLTYLTLSFNKITLLTHHQINYTLPRLRYLGLSGCNLRDIPYFIKFLDKLKIVYLTDNNIHGEIPHWIWNASDHLQGIRLSGNFLTSMETNLFALACKNLIAVDISDNLLQGNLPIPPRNIVQYSVSDNTLTGDISPMICDAMSLKLLDLSYNSLSGPIPQCLSNSIEALVLQNNNFSGTIPQTYTEECNLKLMDLSQNQLTGKIPKSLSNCKMLQILDLSNNRIKQTFPMWLGTLLQLQVLILHSNKFHGVMGSPKFPSGFPVLRIIDLSDNSLTGDLPVEYIQIWNAMRSLGTYVELYMKTELVFTTNDWEWTIAYDFSISLTNKGAKREYSTILNIFTAIDLSSNKFTGQIPESFGSLKALQLLNLSNNELSGFIPPSLSNLRQLESLDLSQNKLSGVIPQQLADQLNFLEIFNVSYNLLSGPIPQGAQFKTFDNNSYMENWGLCGFPLSKNCGTLPSPTADEHDNAEDDHDDVKFPSGFDWVFILAGLGSGLVVGFVVGYILMDRHPWLINGIVHTKNKRMQKRQII